MAAPATRSPLEGPRTTRLGRAATSTAFASSRGRGRGATKGRPRGAAGTKRGEISAGREGGADASGARGALGNSPAARAFATRGAVAPILPAKETVRAAILTLRVCVLKWMTAGGRVQLAATGLFALIEAQRIFERGGGQMTNGPLFMAQECMVFSDEKRRNVEINKPLFQTLTFALYKKIRGALDLTASCMRFQHQFPHAVLGC